MQTQESLIAEMFCAFAGAKQLRQIRFHDLRHTCATLLLARGVSPRVVMDILGHSQIAVTMNIYGHVIPAMQEEAADKIDAALQGDEDQSKGEAGEGRR